MTLIGAVSYGLSVCIVDHAYIPSAVKADGRAWVSLVDASGTWAEPDQFWPSFSEYQ